VQYSLRVMVQVTDGTADAIFALHGFEIEHMVKMGCIRLAVEDQVYVSSSNC
jgi:hypothetical protein